jgi:S1-C subfamily serine protease
MIAAGAAGGIVVALAGDRGLDTRVTANAPTAIAPAASARQDPGAASWAGIARPAARGVVEITASRTVRFEGRGSTPGADASSDLAVVRIAVSARHLHPLPLGASASLALGAPVLAIGAPFGYAGSASAGIVSGFDREIQSPNGYVLSDAIQTDAAVNHGSSGGPLIDVAGRVVGVNAQLAISGADANVGVAFAIPLVAGTRNVNLGSQSSARPEVASDC